MPGINKTATQNTSPIWAQDELDRHALLAGGSFLQKSEFALPNADGTNIVYAGTLVGRTFAEKDLGIGFGPVNLTTDTQIYLLLFDVDFDDKFLGSDGQCSLYRRGCQVLERSLPGYSTMSATTKQKIRALYEVI
jgi:hypothetical protein